MTPHPLWTLGVLALLWGPAPCLGGAKTYRKVQGAQLPAWCRLQSLPVGPAVQKLQLACSAACSRAADCSFFCYTAGLCDLFAGQMAPYFEGNSDVGAVEYQFCFTTWAGDPLNIATPPLAVMPVMGYIESPQLVKDGFFCEWGGGGYVAPPNFAPSIIIDFGAPVQVSTIRHFVRNAPDSKDLKVALGNSQVVSQNKIVYRRDGEGVEGEFEQFVLDPPEMGRYICFYREGPPAIPIDLGEIYVYE